MRDVVIAGAVRTAIGKFGGTLAEMSAVDLGAGVATAALDRAGIPGADVDEVIFGHVDQAGAGLNPARQVVLKAGLPITVPGFTVNMVCASGMRAVALAAQAVASGEHDIVLAGGMECMSAAPFLLDKARWGYRLGDDALHDAILTQALQDPTEGCHMGMTAENLASEFSIGREEQDAFAAASQQKAGAAIAAEAFRAEIVPLSIPRRRGDPLCFETDEFPRPETTAEKLAALRPAFAADGTVTAGNSSGINDGAAAMVLLTREEAKRRGIVPLGRIVSWASAAVEPSRMGMGPAPATRGALGRAGLTLGDIDCVELNEAFAAQSLAVMRELELEPQKVNLNGGAIALGHPVGASGARILVTLVHLLAARQAGLGLATLCVGGGQGMAMVVRRED
jgi:acetyl-CoA C-acetyltransferase